MLYMSSENSPVCG